MYFTRFAQILRMVYRALHLAWRVEGYAMPDNAAVYLIHHQNMFGPVHFLGLWPKETHIWSLGVFLDRASCFDQFYRYTYRERFGWPRLPAFCVAKLLSRVVPSVLRAFSVIPVHRGEANLITMRASLDALRRGESLSICPDIAYNSNDPTMGELYTGFLVLGELYSKRTGQALPFFPVYVSKKKRMIVLGQPIHMEPGMASSKEARAETAKRISAAVNSLGRACGDIKLDKETGL